MTLNYFDWFNRIVESLCENCSQHEKPTTECGDGQYDDPPGERPGQTDYG
jgi:hypothetical protein